MKFHVHVYKVVEKYEVDTEAENEETAMRTASAIVKDGKAEAMPPETNFVMVAFPAEADGQSTAP